MKLITQLHLVLGLRMSGAIPLLPIYAFTAYTARSLTSLLLTSWTLTTVCNCSNNVDSTVHNECLICHILFRIQRQWEAHKTSVTSNAKYCPQLKRRVLTLTSCVESPHLWPNTVQTRQRSCQYCLYHCLSFPLVAVCVMFCFKKKQSQTDAQI
jgi:hypothetical protein